MAVEFSPVDNKAAIASAHLFHRSLSHPWTVFLDPSDRNVVLGNLLAVSLVGYSGDCQAPFCPGSSFGDWQQQLAGPSSVQSLGLPPDRPQLFVI